jgi:hypothetical protein
VKVARSYYRAIPGAGVRLEAGMNIALVLFLFVAAFWSVGISQNL